MKREARLLIALLGMWGGAFAWTEATRPAPQHVRTLRFPRDPQREEASPLRLWSPRPIAPQDARPQRDLFTRAAFDRGPGAVAVTATPTAIATPSSSATPLLVPFRYVGFVADGSGRKVLLSGENGVKAVGDGDLLDGGWRVQGIGEREVRLVHLSDGREGIVERAP